MPVPFPKPSAQAPNRRLGLTDLSLVVLNTVVGAGVVALPGYIAAAAGRWSLAALAVAALASFTIGLAFCLLARRYEGAGGPYLYVRQTLGRRAGLATAACIIPTRILATGVSLKIAVDVLQQLLPPGWPAGQLILPLGVLYTALALRQIVVPVRLGNALGVMKLSVLISIVVLAAGSDVAPQAPLTAEGSQPGYAVLLWFYAFSGFEGVTILAGEAREARRFVPLALLMGLAGAAVLYAGLMATCLAYTPDLPQASQPLLAAVRTMAAPWAGMAAVAFSVFIFSTLPTQFAVAPRLLASLAMEGGAFRHLQAKADGTSRLAVVLCALVAIVSTWLPLPSLLVASSGIRLASYALCSLGLMWPSPAQQRVRYHEIVGGLALLTCLLLTALALVS